MLEIQTLAGEHMDTPVNEPWHLRGAVNGNEITLAVREEDGTTHTIVIMGARPLLGHPKTEGCCP